MHGGKLVRARAIAAVGCKGGVCLAHSGELQGEHGRSERGTEDACRGGTDAWTGAWAYLAIAHSRGWQHIRSSIGVTTSIRCNYKAGATTSLRGATPVTTGLTTGVMTTYTNQYKRGNTNVDRMRVSTKPSPLT